MTTFIFSLLLALAGLLLLLGGGELLVGGARALARRWGMPPLLIGLTVVAFGTSLPELFISLAATWRGVPGIMLGNVIGSNIANIGLILGISLLLAPLRLGLRSLAAELVLLQGASLVLLALTWYGYFPRLVGLGFVATLLAYTIIAYGRAAVAGRADERSEEEAEEEAGPPAATGKSLFLVLLGLIALAGGAELFLRGSVEIARWFGVSELLIGLTLAAVGTSLPELATCLAAIRQRQDALLVGNIIGSNLFNLLMVMGVTASLLPFALPPELLLRDLPVMLLFSLVPVFFLARQGRMDRWLGGLLLAGYLAYIALLFW